MGKKKGCAGQGRATQREPLSHRMPLGDLPLSPGPKAVARNGSFIGLPTSLLIKPQIPLYVRKIAKCALSAWLFLGKSLPAHSCLVSPENIHTSTVI